MRSGLGFYGALPFTKSFGDAPEPLPQPTFAIGNTNSRIRFAKGPAAFMDAWCAEGPTHHVALGSGHQLPRIRKVAELMGLELAAVD